MCAINNGDEVACAATRIYTKEVELKQEHQGTNVSFLNLDINIVDEKFVYTLYSKKNSFPFFILRMLHIDSNIPNNIFYSSFVPETLKIAPSIVHFSDSLPNVRGLASRKLR